MTGPSALNPAPCKISRSWLKDWCPLALRLEGERLIVTIALFESVREVVECFGEPDIEALSGAIRIGDSEADIVVSRPWGESAFRCFDSDSEADDATD
jgi:hypothetical protein